MSAFMPGLDRAMNDLAKGVRKIQGRTIQGLIKGMIVVMAESQRRTPVDTGNLRASHFLAWRGPDGNLGGINTSPPPFSDEKGGADDATQSHMEAVQEAQSMLDTPGVVIGVGASYASYVHEDLEAHHAPGKEAKFLQHAFEEKLPEVLKIIERNARTA